MDRTHAPTPAEIGYRRRRLYVPLFASPIVFEFNLTVTRLTHEALFGTSPSGILRAETSQRRREHDMSGHTLRRLTALA
jgi:hypothetical protein